MAEITAPIVNISKGFPFKITINEVLGSGKKYMAVLRLHNRKDGIITKVDELGNAIWTDKQTSTLRRNKKYDLEVWDYNESTKDELGHKLFVKENVFVAKETYISMNGKVASDFDAN